MTAWSSKLFKAIEGLSEMKTAVERQMPFPCLSESLQLGFSCYEGCGVLFRPSATASRIGPMESCTCQHGGPPTTTPPAWYENVMDGWGARPLR